MEEMVKLLEENKQKEAVHHVEQQHNNLLLDILLISYTTTNCNRFWIVFLKITNWKAKMSKSFAIGLVKLLKIYVQYLPEQTFVFV